MEEYIKYFRRPLPTQMWHWETVEAVKAIAGFSVVLKKDPSKQRKLLMQCAANYWWSDCRKRENHGMLGGVALARVHAETGCIAAGALDESNAFTSVLCPPWMWGWCTAPPVVAKHLWDILPIRLTSRISPETLVYPQYMRLAMGSSHSVHLLMNANINIIGRVLLASHRVDPPKICADVSLPVVPFTEIMEDQAFEPEPEPPVLQERADRYDDLWEAKRMADSASASKLSLEDFCEMVRSLKRLPYRTFVVLNLFAGPRRNCDVEQWCTDMARSAGLVLLLFR